MPLELTSHPEMNTPNSPVRFKLCHQIFASSRPRADGGSCHCSTKQLNSSGTCNNTIPADFNPRNLKGRKTIRQTSANRLNFR